MSTRDWSTVLLLCGTSFPAASRRPDLYLFCHTGSWMMSRRRGPWCLQPARSRCGFMCPPTPPPPTHTHTPPPPLPGTNGARWSPRHAANLLSPIAGPLTRYTAAQLAVGRPHPVGAAAHGGGAHQGGQAGGALQMAPAEHDAPGLERAAAASWPTFLQALHSFRDNRTSLLLATPAAARGLDLPAVSVQHATVLAWWLPHRKPCTMISGICPASDRVNRLALPPCCPCR